MKSKNQSNIKDIDYGNLEKLKQEHCWLNYRQLCECLNIPYLNGCSKQKQINELRSICELEQDATKYRINSICDNREIILFNNRSVYLPYIELLLLNTFNSLESDILFVTTKEILILCNMINKNYESLLNSDMYFNSMLVAQANNFNHQDFYKYLSSSYNSVLQPIVTTALNSMENRKEISINKGFRLYKKIKINNIEIISPAVEVTETDALGKELFKIDGNVLTKMGLTNMSDLYGQYSWRKQEYYSECNKMLQWLCKNDPMWIENKWDFDCYYRCNAIILNVERIKNNIGSLKNELNLKIQSRLLTTKTLDTLRNIDRKQFVKATISKEGEYEYNFIDDIKLSKI